jgi:hypothetical protein
LQGTLESFWAFYDEMAFVVLAEYLDTKLWTGEKKSFKLA